MRFVHSALILGFICINVEAVRPLAAARVLQSSPVAAVTNFVHDDEPPVLSVAEASMIVVKETDTSSTSICGAGAANTKPASERARG